MNGHRPNFLVPSANQKNIFLKCKSKLIQPTVSFQYATFHTIKSVKLSHENGQAKTNTDH